MGMTWRCHLGMRAAIICLPRFRGLGMHISYSAEVGMSIVTRFQVYRADLSIPYQDEPDSVPEQQNKQSKATQISTRIKVHTLLASSLSKTAKWLKRVIRDSTKNDSYGCPLGCSTVLLLSLLGKRVYIKWRSISTRVSHRVGGLPTPYWRAGLGLFVLASSPQETCQFCDLSEIGLQAGGEQGVWATLFRVCSKRYRSVVALLLLLLPRTGRYVRA
ncbi:hypothetical protein V8C42DRAFT_307644 [Trichoderma barbatum]